MFVHMFLDTPKPTVIYTLEMVMVPPLRENHWGYTHTDRENPPSRSTPVDLEPNRTVNKLKLLTRSIVFEGRWGGVFACVVSHNPRPPPLLRTKTKAPAAKRQPQTEAPGARGRGLGGGGGRGRGAGRAGRGREAGREGHPSKYQSDQSNEKHLFRPSATKTFMTRHRSRVNEKQK